MIELLRPIPAVALIPLALVLFGLGIPMHRYVVAFAAVWPILINTIYGVRGTDPFLHDVARTSGVGRGGRLVRVTLPAALPSIATGIRISASLALLVCVTAEFVVGTRRRRSAPTWRQQQSAVRIPELYARRPRGRAARVPRQRGAARRRAAGDLLGRRQSGRGRAGDGAGRPVAARRRRARPRARRVGAWARAAGSFDVPPRRARCSGPRADVWPTSDFLGAVAASLEPARRRGSLIGAAPASRSDC